MGLLSSLIKFIFFLHLLQTCASSTKRQQSPICLNDRFLGESGQPMPVSFLLLLVPEEKNPCHLSSKDMCHLCFGELSAQDFSQADSDRTLKETQNMDPRQRRLVGWSLTPLFSTNTAISEMKGPDLWWRVIITQ